MLDAAALAKVITSVLAPAVPYLVKAGDQAWGEASKKLGADVWDPPHAPPPPPPPRPTPPIPAPPNGKNGCGPQKKKQN